MIFLTLSVLLYFAPALLATSRRAPNATAIWLTNFFVGWTVIGWIICLIWALSTPPLPYTVPVAAGGPIPPAGPMPQAVPYATPGYTPSSTTGYTSQAAGAGAVPTWNPVTGTVDSSAAAEPERTCIACGRIVPADARFCPACGSVESRLG